ncbi:MAG: hydroxymethylbilane synthase [Kiloniellales bacterium]
MKTTPLLRLGTRGSDLALVQTEEVRRRLGEAHDAFRAPDAVEIVVIKTTGDRVQDRPLSEVGGKGLFTKEIEEALLDGRIDAAVHSMKDLPTWLPEGLEIGAVLPREDARDAFFSNKGTDLAALPTGAVVGTASLRRQAQVLALRPDLVVTMLRGNVPTRLRKLAEGQVDATILALAGLKRLGLEQRITSVIPTEIMLPAVAQGAIGLEQRRGDDRTRAWLAAIDDQDTQRRVQAERACLEVLDGSCRTPIAAYAELKGDSLRLRGLVALPDGSKVHRAELSGPAVDPVLLGRAVGKALRAAAGPDFFDMLERI